ncbi:PspA/IM30 family protein, partial [Methylopila musalis]
MRRPAPHASTTLSYLLSPTAEQRAAIDLTFERYGEMGRIVAELQAGAGSNLAALHDRAYAAIRERTGLPARLITLGLRDFTAHAWDPDLFGVPLDDKLFAIKGPDVLSLSTVQGRVEITYDVGGYSAGWRDPFWARLVRDGDRYDVRVGVAPRTSHDKDGAMARDSILSRVGRLLAGVANTAIDQAENRNPVAVVEQAIREIDRSADEARADLGKALAERHRIEARLRDLGGEKAGYDAKIETALAQGREDLARAGVARQIDLESQIEALARAAAEIAEEVEDAQKALAAIAGAGRGAEARLSELKRSLARHAPE